MPPIMLAVKSARLGVGKCGLEGSRRQHATSVQSKEHGEGRKEVTNLASLSMRKFWDRSAAKLAAGEELWRSLTLK